VKVEVLDYWLLPCLEADTVALVVSLLEELKWVGGVGLNTFSDELFSEAVVDVQ
jgi:hypothetical protein